MKPTLLFVLFAATMVVGAACSSTSGGSPGTGGASASGGTNNAGGVTARGGSGGTQGPGGAAGSGGARDSGGVQSTGGVRDTGGALGDGGKQGSGGAVGTGGARATGGAQGTGGATGTGGSSAGDAGRDAVAKDDAAVADTAAPKDGQDGASDGGRGDTQSEGIRTRQITTRGFTFDVREIGSGGEPVLLLHGFPDTSLEWTSLMPVLAAAGYHCLAPDQRGYSPGARPTEVDAYKYEELVADAFAIASELGERFHLVGHDWGTNVGWLMLEKDPSRIASFTAISIPHYQAWARSVYDDTAMAGYLSMLNTWMAEGTGEAYWTAARMKSMWAAKPADLSDATIAHMLEPGAMTAALNWYRASRGHKRAFEEFDVWTVSVPTLLIHGSTDLGERSLTDTVPLMTGPYRVARPKGGHFIVDEQPKAVADETLAHLRAYPIK